MTHEEYVFLKKWIEMHPKQRLTSPIPANDLMQRLIDMGFLEPITRPDASNLKVNVVIGYNVTTAGEDAFQRHQDNRMAL